MTSNQQKAKFISTSAGFVSDSKSAKGTSVSGKTFGMIDALTGGQKLWLRMQILLWLIGLSIFLVWWMRAEHFVGAIGYVVSTVLIAWTFVIPGYFLYFVQRMKLVDPEVPIPVEWRVAIVTTRAPSEPFEVTKRTLEAMISQEREHDNWLADEDPTTHIVDWCDKHGVKVSTRRGVADYHNSQWPRRTKCKEGNLAYFYDNFGYEAYDIVIQLDADHVPTDGYLEAMLRPFVFADVGYVSAPSICDSNASRSWSARGRLFSEALMHGPLQAGYNAGFAPLCIGSHYAVRTEALKEINGLGPELAEDHSTTLLLNAAGWRGIHALDAIAHGEGPPTFADCITQEFQWSRSLMVLLLTLLPQCWKKLPIRLRIQFLFSELWYPLFSLSMLLGVLLPVWAVTTGRPLVSVNYFDFLLYITPLFLALMSIHSSLINMRLLRPVNTPLLCWEVALFQLVRWPWALYGSLMGVWCLLRRKSVSFKVTPKGEDSQRLLPWKVLIPYKFILVGTFLPGFFFSDAGDATGYHFFIILAQVCYGTALFCLVLIHYHEVRTEDAS